MGLIEHNIEREKNFVSLFGYSVLETEDFNIWDIVDKNNKRIGYILYKENEKENMPNTKVFGYRMVIKTEDILYDMFREEKEIDRVHEFAINSKENGKVNVYLQFEKALRLVMWTDEDDALNKNVKPIIWINFIIDDKVFQLQMKSSTKSFNTYELLDYETNTKKTFEGRKKYQYWLTFRDKPFKIDDCENQKSEIRNISAVSTPQDRHSNKMTITEQFWTNGKRTVNTKCRVKGTIEELAEKQDLAINAVNHFRYLANNVFPFEEDVIEKLCPSLIGKRDDLAIFIPEFGSLENQNELKYKRSSI